MNESNKVSRAIYVVPVIYVLGMYMMPVLFWIICNMQEATDSFDAGWIMVMPIVLGLINLAVVLILGKRISRVQLLICTRIIKYALIPFYVVGGFCIVVALLLMFTPVVIMIFVGPTVAIVLSVIGWLGLLGATPFSIAYIVRACSEGVQGDKTEVQTAVDGLTAEGDQVTVNGKTYTYTKKGGTGKTDEGWVEGTTATEGSTLAYGKKGAANPLTIANGDKVTTTPKTGASASYTAAEMDNGVSKADPSIISAAKAVSLMTDELIAANKVGVTNGTVEITGNPAYDKDNGVTFNINKGSAEVANKLSFSLHVGSDADMTNKITVGIETMNSSYLGIKGLNVNDDSGIAGTYAIDAISDALQKVSDQRSSLGAVQNRLEHTIDNLDNVVENTTSAESRIRDTDMAKEMVNYSKNNILAQAGQSMLAQANQSNQGVLSLLQ